MNGPTDREAFTTLTKLVPKTYQGKMPTELGLAVMHVVEKAATDERRRSISIVRGIQQEAARVGQQAQQQQNAAVDMQARAVVNACEQILVLVLCPPGTCKTCRGSSEVQSVVAAAAGRRATVPCPDCRPTRLTAVPDQTTEPALEPEA